MNPRHIATLLAPNLASENRSPAEIPATAMALGETGHWLAVKHTYETTELWDIDRDHLSSRTNEKRSTSNAQL